MKIWVDENDRPDNSWAHFKNIEELDKFIKDFDKRINRLIKLCEENPLSKVVIPDVQCISIGTIEPLNWMIKNNKKYPIHIHASDPTVVVDIKTIIKENRLEEFL